MNGGEEGAGFAGGGGGGGVAGAAVGGGGGWVRVAVELAAGGADVGRGPLARRSWGWRAQADGLSS